MKKIILLVFALVFLVSLHLPLTKESTSFFETTVCVDPTTNDVSVGNTFVINVSLADDISLQSFEFYLGYNTTILDGLNAWVNPPYETPVEPQINDTEGYVNVFAVYGGPIPSSASASESFPLASIAFNATAVGSSFLDLYGIILEGFLGTQVDHTTVNGSVTVSSGIITVPDDYPTIQEAINAANEGDTIFVEEGIYYENVVMNKSISLIGENKNTTIIDGNRKAMCIHVTANNVTVSGFTIRKGSYHPHPFGGIRIYHSTGNNISNNFITDHHVAGVFLSKSNSNIVSRNVITNISEHISYPGGAIYLDSSSDNKITENTIKNATWYGIGMDNSSRNIINGNTMTEASIDICDSPRNTINDNTVANSLIGICLVRSSHNNLSKNTLTSNTGFGWGSGMEIADSNENTITTLYH